MKKLTTLKSPELAALKLQVKDKASITPPKFLRLNSSFSPEPTNR